MLERSLLLVDSVGGASGSCTFGGDGLGNGARTWPVDGDGADGAGAFAFGVTGGGPVVGSRDVLCVLYTKRAIGKYTNDTLLIVTVEEIKT